MESTTSTGEQAIPMYKRLLKNFIEPNYVSPFKDAETDRELVDLCSKGFFFPFLFCSISNLNLICSTNAHKIVIKDDFNSIKPKESDPKPIIGDANNQKLPSIFRNPFSFNTRGYYCFYFLLFFHFNLKKKTSDEWIDYKKKMINAIKKTALFPDECIGLTPNEFLSGKQDSDESIKNEIKKNQESLLKDITERFQILFFFLLSHLFIHCSQKNNKKIEWRTNCSQSR